MKNADIGPLIRRINGLPHTKAIKLPSVAGFLESGTPDLLIVADGRPVPRRDQARPRAAHPDPEEARRGVAGGRRDRRDLPRAARCSRCWT